MPKLSGNPEIITPSLTDLLTLVADPAGSPATKRVTITNFVQALGINQQSIFKLNADGVALGPTIADYFGASSAFPTVAGAIYEFVFYLRFLKTTSGTAVFTLTNTQAYTNLSAYWRGSPASGVATVASTQGGGVQNITTAAAALPATAALTSTAEHLYTIRAIATIGLAGNIRLQVTSSAGTITPRRGSFYTARLLPAGNVGTFVA